MRTVLAVSILMLAVTLLHPSPLRIDGFEQESITNSIGNPAKRFTFTVSGLEAGTTNYISAKSALDDPLWFVIGSWIPTNDVETVVHSNAQAFVQDGGYFRIEKP